MPYAVELYENGQKVWEHEYDCRGKKVIITYPTDCCIGDAIAWTGQATRFMDKHGCRLVIVTHKALCELFQKSNPSVTFVDEDEFVKRGLNNDAYATYRIGIFIKDKDAEAEGRTPEEWQDYTPVHYRTVSLHDMAAYILGLFPQEKPPFVHIQEGGRPIPEKYVCISVQSTRGQKHWNNPTGWHHIVKYLKKLDYRVICIDKSPVYHVGIHANCIPNGAEDETGNRPLSERARWIRYADLFVGLSSGLSWLSWAVGTPTVLVSGFTHPLTEFKTPYRVINWNVCNSCWNDQTSNWEDDRNDFFACPRHKGDQEKHWECSRFITFDQVKEAIDRAIADHA
jgi:autotransporter strand-loop-strand O-heptosyltransferase